jgi:hypothetical protein
MSDEARSYTEAAVSEGRALDGVEGVLTMSDPATGDALSITLFRDQAALDAYQAFSREKVAEIGEEFGEEVEAPRVYSEVIVAL